MLGDQVTARLLRACINEKGIVAKLEGARPQSNHDHTAPTSNHDLSSVPNAVSTIIPVRRQCRRCLSYRFGKLAYGSEADRVDGNMLGTCARRDDSLPVLATGYISNVQMCSRQVNETLWME